MQAKPGVSASPTKYHVVTPMFICPHLVPKETEAQIG